MNCRVTSQSTILDTIKNRYFSYSKKSLIHYGDCDIYQANRPFCSCGLLYQLNHLDYYLAEIVYPQYNDDGYLQDHGKKKRINKKKEAETKKLFEAVFGVLEPPALEDIKDDYELYKKVLNACFAQKEFPSVFKRLDKWIVTQVNKND